MNTTSHRLCLRVLALTSAIGIFGLGALAGWAAFPPGPAPQVPGGGGPPGVFPNSTVSGANVVAKGGAAFDSNVEISSFEGQGPIPWTVTKYNRGDLAMRLAP